MNMQNHTGDLQEYMPRGLGWLLWGVASITLALVAVPTVYLLVWSFWGTEVVGRLRPLNDATLDWYGHVLNDPGWQESIGISILLAVAASSTGALLNLVHSYCRHFASTWIRTTTVAAMILVLLNPLVAFGMALRLVGGHVGISPWILLFLGHLVVLLPLQYLVFQASSQGDRREMLWGARTLGSSHPRTLATVHLPHQRQALLGAMVLGFFVSLDEIVLALFVIDGSVSTIPLRLWRGLSHVIQPEAAVVSALLLALVLGTFAVSHAFSQGPPVRTRALTEQLSGFRKELLGFVVTGLATYLLVDPSIASPLSHILKAVISLSAATLAGAAVGLYRARGPIRRLVTTANAEKRSIRGIGKLFAFTETESGIELAEQLRGGGWVEMDHSRIQRFTSLCFKKCKGRYLGTDRNVPSKYYELYPDYIERQLNRGGHTADTRIVLYDRPELLADWSRHGGEVQRFIREHEAAGVNLLSVPWDWAQERAAECGLESPDIALFSGEFVVFFEPALSRDGSGHVLIREINDTLRGSLAAFLARLAEQASTVRLDVSGRPLLTPVADRNALKADVAPETWT